MKAKFFEEDVDHIANEWAERAVDEEIAKRPELFAQRSELLKRKQLQAKKEVQNEMAGKMTDLEIASEYLIHWMESLPPVQQEGVQKEMDRAHEVFQSESFQEKLETSLESAFDGEPLQNTFKLSDDLVQLIYQEGLKNLNDSHFENSKALFYFLTILNPQITDFWAGLGLSAMSLGDLKTAHDCFENVRVMSPTDPKGYYYKSLCVFLEKDPKQAKHLCEEGLFLSEKNSTWHPLLTELNEFISTEIPREI